MYINSTNNAQNPLSPSQLNQALAKLLKSELNSFWLTGEVSDLFCSNAGHSYFSVKDNDASIRCVLFKQQATMTVENGQQIILFGYLSMYAPRGTVQINVLKALDAGSGLLQQQFLQLKQKLELSGLFDQTNKKPLPKLIDDIGIITSPNGAAIKDILEVIKRKNPLINITIYPTAVQGHTAVDDMVHALNRADQANHQTLLLTRGGGSQEDLWCFNDERLARLMAALKTPVLTAIGHERDISIADLTADEVAITPTAAGERLSGQFLENNQLLRNQAEYLNLLMQNTLRNNQQKIDVFSYRLQKRHPSTHISQQHHQLNHLTHLLNRAAMQHRDKAKSQLNQYKINLQSQRPDLERLQSKVKQNLQFMQHLLKSKQQKSQYALHNQISQLASLSPLSVLTRGYSYTTKLNGEVIVDQQQVKANELIETKLKSGKILSKIVERLDK
ncbi:exodeoxyribonuclease VII large subunit [Marinicella gelatinilytica]|uniref:exodeoxyribonuclease VII large subunit n=1 Tax=Marinicella gelatinilytica TaxID=2996017 RepID=UPI002260FC1B|nr:exodeoxyribonuclease VII large subunit [Marinicella gelatinilytica]MCX7544834.1 exodeoxyribonuclease VII large subunit [Marinicella gelatinilytica]